MMDTKSETHRPVMLNEMLDWLAPKDKGVYIDGTFGAGGYSRAILRAADCRVFAIDRDPSTRKFAELLESEFPDRFVWLLGNFSDMCSLVTMHGIHQAEGIVLDLGVSSMQLDQAERGFSFRNNGPLDMRMSDEGLKAADVIAQSSESELADIFYYYGEEKAARKIARAIVNARTETPITTTSQLAEIIRQVVGGKHSKTDPATRSFQGLRIHINQEFDAIENGLKAAEDILAPGGRLVVVTFHSLEDRIVKRAMAAASGRGGASRHDPAALSGRAKASFHLLTPRALRPQEAECSANPRARSARLRGIERMDAGIAA
jgi:16S rRNA (cytosine1402-N4)-methyltransferase